MSFFLPSDLGRLIYGYLRTSCSEQLAEEFLNTSDSMKECRKYRHIGFDARVHDRTLTQMLNEYSLLSDLIFEHCPESDRSHFNIVSKLQSLLKSRQQQSLKVHLPTDTIPCETSGKSGCTPAEPVIDSLTQILSSTVNVLQEKDPTLRLQSPSVGTKSSPSRNTLSVSRTATTIPNREIPAVNDAPSRNSPPTTPGRILANEDNSTQLPSTNTHVLSEPSSQVKNTSPFRIARSTSSLEKVTPKKTSIPVKCTRKSPENHSTPVASGAFTPQVAVSPISLSSSSEKSLPRSSPLQNFSHDVVDINDVSVTPMNFSIFSAPTTPVKSGPTRERKSSHKLSTPTKRRNEDRTPERRIEIPSVPTVNQEEILCEQVPVTSASKEPTKSVEITTSETTAKNLLPENSSSQLQSPKPLVKILPKVSPNLKKYCKNDFPAKNKNSRFVRPPCSEPMPWDFNLRLSLTNVTDSADRYGDVSRKECKNLVKKDRDISITNSKTESNKRKHDKKTIVCKKRKKLEEAMRANKVKKDVAETSVSELAQVLEKGAHSSKTVFDKDIEMKEQKTSETQAFEKTDQLNSVVLIPSTFIAVVNNGCDVNDENDYLLRQTISEEMVLYHKDSIDLSSPSIFAC